MGSIGKVNNKCHESKFKHFNKFFPNNQRPVQPLNKRNIKLGTFVELGSFK